jgi:hypothetical protein
MGRLLFLPASLALAAAASADAPLLKAMADFEPGRFRTDEVGAGGKGQSHCIADPDQLLTGGGPAPACQFRVIEDGDAQATVTYRCPGGRSGRTVLRRDAAGIYTLDAQGLANGLPFAARSEWRRVGSC